MKSPRVTESQIRERAYQLYLQRGYQPGHEKDDWLQAEYELMHLSSTQPNEVLCHLHEEAKALAARDLPYAAFVFLRHYDGVFAEETKQARLEAAETFLELSRHQPH